ncbi:MAG TPA: DUF4397 domain-containing protein [Granulicella sp.]
MRHALHALKGLAPSLCGKALRAAACLSAAALLAGCQGLARTGNSAMVRVIDVSPDSPALDVYQGNNAVAYNLSSGTVTSYVPVAPGHSAFTISPAGSRRPLSLAEGDLRASGRYTVLVGRSLADMQPILLADHVHPASTAEASAPLVRIVNQAERTGPVDVYLVPAGERLTAVAPIATRLEPGANTGYIAAPACTCAAVFLPAGTVPSAGLAAHIGAQLHYAAGEARTFILLDPQTESSILQVITADDEDSPPEAR